MVTIIFIQRPQMSRVLSISEAHINSVNAFLLEPYRKRLKRCAGCMSEFLHDLHRIQERVALRRSPMSVLAQDVLPLQNIVHHPDFDIAKVVVVVTLV